MIGMDDGVSDMRCAQLLGWLLQRRIWEVLFMQVFRGDGGGAT